MEGVQEHETKLWDMQNCAVDKEKPSSSVKKPIPDHYLEGGGKPGDGIIYLNDDGEYVKIDKKGHLRTKVFLYITTAKVRVHP